MLAVTPGMVVDTIMSLIRASFGLHKFMAVIRKLIETPICASEQAMADSILGGVGHLGVGRT